MNDTTPRRGRPPRAEASVKALEGVNVAAVDPLDVLRQIVADSSAPASARVRAAKILIDHKADAERAKQNADAFGWPQAAE